MRRPASAASQRLEGGRARIDVVGEALGLGERSRHSRLPNGDQILWVEGDDDRRRITDRSQEQAGIIEESDGRNSHGIKTEVGAERAIGCTSVDLDLIPRILSGS